MPALEVTLASGSMISLSVELVWRPFTVYVCQSEHDAPEPMGSDLGLGRNGKKFALRKTLNQDC